jgi:heme/copper-type cytochrome/quinol oxidase subunit 1
VLIGGALFPLFGAVYYWFPKVYDRMLSERLARWQFVLLFTKTSDSKELQRIFWEY